MKPRVSTSSQTERDNTVAKSVQKPVSKPVSKPNPAPSREQSDNGENYSSGRTFNMSATAYTAFCEGCIGITASGVDVRNTIWHEGKRVIAVDKRIIPLGTTVRVEGGGQSFIATAEDTGGAIKGNKIDILVGSNAEAFSWGVRSVTVTILE